ncbi:unnamed protein product [Gongylonema pulchrum]|uniref:Uncharacterized protein n=1 Tax=Gongylonema pulchrum TaxID=637853 RepID=A0A183ENT8_9BILA|nr:unnamed protein product [Gongylonema pulchrum]
MSLTQSSAESTTPAMPQNWTVPPLVPEIVKQLLSSAESTTPAMPQNWTVPPLVPEIVKQLLVTALTHKIHQTKLAIMKLKIEPGLHFKYFLKK